MNSAPSIHRSLLAAVAVAALALPSFVRAEATTKPAYPLTTDVVTGEALPANGGTVATIDGREVHFAKPENEAAFKAGGEAMQKKMDDAVIAAEKPAYKLDVCPVSDEKLGGDMGKPIQYVDRKSNQLIELCCNSCLKKVRVDPTEALKKVAEANAKG